VGLDVELVRNVADTKSFLNPMNNDSWTHSRFKRHQNITKYRYFHIQKAANNDVHVRTKTAYNKEWSHPKCPIKGQGPEPTKAVGHRVPPADRYGPNVIKPREVGYRNGVMNSLDLCRVRISAEAYQTLLLTYEEIFSATPVSFIGRTEGCFGPKPRRTRGVMLLRTVTWKTWRTKSTQRDLRACSSTGIK
jgi:hypothetical protein